ncbi:Acetyltransferase, GNAT family [Mycena kentingensis (nom. inval.)]|nr:Acetyltransferase, GNAT family [Mycena kentingensis (nom. inval.)]
MPLEFSASAKPILRLPALWINIVITPPRLSDAAPSVAIMNDPAVAPNMGVTPEKPYTIERAEAWIAKVKGACDAAVHQMQDASAGAGEQLKFAIGGCPVRHIREVRADGEEVYIGDVGLARSGFLNVKDKEERARLVAENEARVAGDPEIVWHIGYYLAPSHHGRGIMSAVVHAMIHEWGVSRMGVHLVRSNAFEGNFGSLKVLKKNGFMEVDYVPDVVQIGEQKRGMHFLEWSASM